MQEGSGKITDAELCVMQVVWQAKKPLTMTEIMKALKQSTNWKDSTIKTLVRRLEAKGALLAGQDDVRTYDSTVSQKEYAMYATDALLQSVFNGDVQQMLGVIRQLRTREDRQPATANIRRLTR